MVKDPHGRLLQAVEAPDGRFDHVFLHSVHRSQVIERFRIEGSGGSRARLHLFELVYEDAGVGMPTDAEGGLRLENGRFVLSMDRGFAAIPIRVSVVPGHGLAIDGAWWPLRNFARPGEGIVLAARMALKIRFRR